MKFLACVVAVSAAALSTVFAFVGCKISGACSEAEEMSGLAERK